MMMIKIRHIILIAALVLPSIAKAETPEEWIALGTRVHGGFGSFIPLGIKIGLDAKERLKVPPRQIAVDYYDSNESPCACFADGIAIATSASVGQRSLRIMQDKAPEGSIAVAIIRPRQGGAGFMYTIPALALVKLGSMNRDMNERQRFDAVMAADGLFQVVPAP